MSFAVFAIGALHALPPFLAAATTQSRTVAVLVGGASIFVGAAYGPTTYAGIDVAFAVLGTVIGWIIVPESGSSAREASPTTYSPPLKKTAAPDSGSVIRTVSNSTSSLSAKKLAVPTAGSSARASTSTTYSTPKSESENSLGDTDEEREWVVDYIYTVCTNSERIIRKRVQYWEKKGWTNAGFCEEFEKIFGLNDLINALLLGHYLNRNSAEENVIKSLEKLIDKGVLTSSAGYESIMFDFMEAMKDEGLISARFLNGAKESYRKERRKARS